MWFESYEIGQPQNNKNHSDNRIKRMCECADGLNLCVCESIYCEAALMWHPKCVLFTKRTRICTLRTIFCYLRSQCSVKHKHTIYCCYKIVVFFSFFFAFFRRKKTKRFTIAIKKTLTFFTTKSSKL